MTAAAVRPPLYAGWKVVGVAFLVALYAWGFGFYGATVYVAALTARNGWSVAEVSGAVTAFYLAGAAITTRTADLLDRFGPRRTVSAGLLLTAAGVLGIAWLDALWQLYLAMLPLAVGWSLTSGAAINAFVAPWFDRRRGLAISLALNGASAGGLLLLPLWVVLNERIGFPAATHLLLAGMLALLLPLVRRFLESGPQALGLHPDGVAAGPSAAPAAPASAYRVLIRNWRFWTVAGPFALGLFAQVGFLTHQLAFLAPALGAEPAALAIGIGSFCALAGRLTTGFFIDRINRRVAAATSFVMQAGALGLLLASAEPWALYLGVAVFGLGVGNMITFPGLILQREFAARDFGRVVSIQVAVGQVTFAFGPGAIGWLRTATGGYDAALGLCLAIMLLAAGGVLIGAFSQRPS